MPGLKIFWCNCKLLYCVKVIPVYNNGKTEQRNYNCVKTLDTLGRFQIVLFLIQFVSGKSCYAYLFYMCVPWAAVAVFIIFYQAIMNQHEICDDWIHIIFLAVTKQLYEWFSPSVGPSVCPSVGLSHLFDYVPIIISSWNFQELLPMTEVMSMQKVKVRGQRSRSQRSTPNLAVSGL